MWEAVLKDGSIVAESTHKWTQIKNDIESLSFDYNGTTVNLPPSNEFIQYKSASASLMGGKAEIESQTVGFKVGENKVLLRFDFKSKKVNILVE